VGPVGAAGRDVRPLRATSVRSKDTPLAPGPVMLDSTTQHHFSEETLTELLRALRARTSRHPSNPGIVASWPGVRETLMDAACGELAARGHPVFRVAIPGRSRDGWAIRSTTEAAARDLADRSG
jgi:hypothetical protein